MNFKNFKFSLSSLLSLSLFLSLSLSLTACAPPRMNGLFQDPSFTYTSIQQGGLAIGGVSTSGTKPASPALIAENSHYAELFREGLINARPGISIMPAGDIAQTMGANYDKMMDYYAYRDVIAESDLNAIKAKTSHIRYVVFANIPTNTTSQSYNDGGDTLTYSTIRTITISVKAYDLTNNQIVWSGSLSSMGANNNSYQTTAIKNPKNTTEDIVSSLVAGLEKDRIQKTGTYPRAPDSLPIVSQIFDGIGENLPKPPKPTKNKKSPN
jgi:hypothetical protein